MRNHKLEIYVSPLERELTCWVESPKYGQTGSLNKHGLIRSVVLNDGENRVVVGVYHHDLETERIKHVARLAIGKLPVKYDVRN